MFLIIFHEPRVKLKTATPLLFFAKLLSFKHRGLAVTEIRGDLLSDIARIGILDGGVRWALITVQHHFLPPHSALRLDHSASHAVLK